MKTNHLKTLTDQGLTITLKQGYLIIEPQQLLTKELRTYINTHKEIIKTEWLTSKETPATIEQLTTQQLDWLYEIAYYLQVEPEYLLQHQLIDKYDLIELLDKEPILIAKSITIGISWYRLM